MNRLVLNTLAFGSFVIASELAGSVGTDFSTFDGPTWALVLGIIGLEIAACIAGYRSIADQSWSKGKFALLGLPLFFGSVMLRTIGKDPGLAASALIFVSVFQCAVVGLFWGACSARANDIGSRGSMFLALIPFGVFVLCGKASKDVVTETSDAVTA